MTIDPFWVSLLETWLLIIFIRQSVLDIWQGSEYASGSLKLFCSGFKRATREGWYMPNWLHFIILMSYMEVQHSN